MVYGVPACSVWHTRTVAGLKDISYVLVCAQRGRPSTLKTIAAQAYVCHDAWAAMVSGAAGRSVCAFASTSLFKGRRILFIWWYDTRGAFISARASCKLRPQQK